MNNAADFPDNMNDDANAPIAGLAALRTPLAPQHDLWPGIESRITARRLRTQRVVWLAAAGFAAVAAVGTSLVFNAGLHRDGDPDANTAALRTHRYFAAVTPTAGSLADIQVSAHSRQPETRALVRANLKIVNSAESQLRKAMVSDPDAAYLKSLLDATKQQKQQLQLALSDDGDAQ